MRPGVHYNHNYASVAAWEYISILLSIVLLNNWKTMHIDYVLPLPLTPVVRECYLHITKGVEEQSDTEWLLKVMKSI